MFKKGSKLHSIFTGTCPRCQKESMYVEGNPYIFGSLFEMHDRCSHCRLKYKMEPSFFFGAMYVSYGLGVAVAVAAFVISVLIIGTGLLNAFIIIILAILVLIPIIIRLSRNIWINMFVKYDGNTSKP